jgi:cytochrome P450
MSPPSSRARARCSSLGASLARLEGRIAIEETLRRFPAWNVDPAGTQMMHTSTVRGYRNVAITL